MEFFLELISWVRQVVVEEMLTLVGWVEEEVLVPQEPLY
jgi:hypothetical protein